MGEAIALAIGLSMDAAAVAATQAANRREGSRARQGAWLVVLFAGFQAGMAAAGWVVGDALGDWIEPWDHWLAFGILSLLGILMLMDARRGARQSEPPSPLTSMATRLVLAVVTSLDAAAAGTTLPLLPTPPAITIAIIGAVTGALVAGAFGLAHRLGQHAGSRLEFVGGIALIAIGARLLVGR